MCWQGAAGIPTTWQYGTRRTFSPPHPDSPPPTETAWLFWAPPDWPARGCSTTVRCVPRSANESAIRREVGTIALMFTGLGSIIGSGWLFGAWRAAQLAGPGAIYAWIIGAVVILFVAFTYAELGAMFPESGGAVRYGHYSHGTLVGFVAGWAGWSALVPVIPVEAEASVQYMSSWPWAWAQALYVHAAHGQGELTTAGLSISAVLVVF